MAEMPHFAEIDEDNKVIRVLVADADFIATQNGRWIQTSYNTIAGRNIRGEAPLRKNFAGIGYTYDEKLDAFIPPQPYKSWILDEERAQYKAPIDPPEGFCKWDEETKSWVAS